MSLQTMLKMSTSSANTSLQSQTPLSNGRRDDAMIKSCPFSHDALFEVDHIQHIVNLGAVDTFLSRHSRIEVRGVWRPQRGWNKIRCLSR